MEIKTQTFLLKTILTVSFLALLTGMIDIYDVMGKLCGVLQIVNLFIWERKQAVISYLGKMIVMVDELHLESSNTFLKIMVYNLEILAFTGAKYVV